MMNKISCHLSLIAQKTCINITAENLQAFLSDMGTDLNHDEVVEMIKAIDTDDDGQVSCEGQFLILDYTR